MVWDSTVPNICTSPSFFQHAAAPLGHLVLSGLLPIDWHKFNQYLQSKISNLLDFLFSSKTITSAVKYCHYHPQRSCGKVIFSQASVILSTGGCVSQHELGQTPPSRADTPQSDTPSGRHTPTPQSPPPRPPLQQTVLILLECFLVYVTGLNFKIIFVNNTSSSTTCCKYCISLDFRPSIMEFPTRHLALCNCVYLSGCSQFKQVGTRSNQLDLVPGCMI